MPQPASNHEFEKLVSGQEDIDLVHLMLEFAGDAYPDLDRVGCLLEIDQLGVACSHVREAGPSHCPRQRLAAISRVLYESEGFHGNHEEYYDPRNSYLNEVLKRRCGIPISLGILYMGVASRAGMRTFGVNSPGHFVLGCQEGNETWYVDPFGVGDVLDQAACRQRIEQMIGKHGVVCDSHFRPATTLEIAARVLRNLKTAYAMQERWPCMLRVQRRLTTLLPACADERRDLGLVYLRTGEPVRALEMLEPFVADCPRDQAEALKPSLKAARRMIAEWN
jgi:regulator of sirC expression with transglutaminase-like and TPR domain